MVLFLFSGCICGHWLYRVLTPAPTDCQDGRERQVVALRLLWQAENYPQL